VAARRAPRSCAVSGAVLGATVGAAVVAGWQGWEMTVIVRYREGWVTIVKAPTESRHDATERAR